MLGLTIIFAGLAAAVPTNKRQTSIPSNVPPFVAEFAPILRLYSGENYMPSDISAQITNTAPYLNRTSLPTAAYPNPLTLDNLDQLNDISNSSTGKDIYLTSLTSPANVPQPAYLFGVSPNNSTYATANATSSVIITVSKPNSTLDAFYFYFYAFDYGGLYPSFAPVLNIGNHVGDWEHNMIRFVQGVPTSVYYSQHSSGQALSYQAAEKWQDTGRSITYVANGTHANYPNPGSHDHTFPGIDLPEGPVEDHTDAAGLVWDPTLSAYYYSYDVDTRKFTAYDGDSPVNYLYFAGHWGDEKFADGDARQECFLGIDALCKWVSGPTGPVDKDLGRSGVCPDGNRICERKLELGVREAFEGRELGGSER